MARRKTSEPPTGVELPRQVDAIEFAPDAQGQAPDIVIRHKGRDGERIAFIEVKQTKGARTILSLKGSDEWSEWLTELAKHCRTDRVGILDRAAAELAERVGFRRPPPRL